MKKLLEDIDKLKINQYSSFTSLFNNKILNELEENIPDYNKIKYKLEMIPTIVLEKESLYDILIILFPNGLETNIIVNELNFIQKEILKICKICFPPNKKVYIPKNECISYETIDLIRRKLIRKLNTTLKKYDLLLNTYEYDLSRGQFEKNCSSYDNTNEKIKNLIYNLHNTFNHIPNYKELIKEQDMELFSNSRIKYIIDEYDNVITYLENNCNSIKINDFIKNDKITY